MSYHDWIEAGDIVDRGVSFGSLVFAILEKCPKDELGRVIQAFPKHWNEYQYRAKRPDGILPTDPVAQTGVTTVKPVPTQLPVEDYPPEFVRRSSDEEKD